MYIVYILLHTCACTSWWYRYTGLYANLNDSAETESVLTEEKIQENFPYDTLENTTRAALKTQVGK